ncbi:MAG: hypothetical protein ACI86X_002271 [Moritella sp.]|jgi:hypothetical protein
MRVLALVLLLLINSFSLPLQAMNSHVMSANIPCNMQAMPAMMPATPETIKGMVDEQIHPKNHTVSDCQTMGNAMSYIDDTPDDMSNAPDDMTNSNCDMSGNGNCSATSSLPFISINKLVIPNRGPSTAILYDTDSLPLQYPESLYRPPLIG